LQGTQESCKYRRLVVVIAKHGNVVSFPHREPEPDADSFLGEVLDGRARVQRSRSLREHHNSVGRRNVMHLADFSGEFPWEWLPADADEWFTHLRAVKNLTHATNSKTSRETAPGLPGGRLPEADFRAGHRPDPLEVAADREVGRGNRR
jgi:hypothetical protein